MLKDGDYRIFMSTFNHKLANCVIKSQFVDKIIIINYGLQNAT